MGISHVSGRHRHRAESVWTAGSSCRALIVLYNAESRLTLRSDKAVEWLALLRFREVLSLIMDPKAGYSISYFPRVPQSHQADALILF
jgi:hypothetical protein